ncbi:MAG: hypothetical protein FWF31_08920 [Desulfobulbus sp.]|nr:hypothetical protein [Desulfobulbus sp.]
MENQLCLAGNVPLNLETTEMDPKALKTGKVDVKIPLPSDGKTIPRIKGQLRFVVSAWNPDAATEESRPPVQALCPGAWGLFGTGSTPEARDAAYSWSWSGQGASVDFVH